MGVDRFGASSSASSHHAPRRWRALPRWGRRSVRAPLLPDLARAVVLAIAVGGLTGWGGVGFLLLVDGIAASARAGRRGPRGARPARPDAAPGAAVARQRARHRRISKLTIDKLRVAPPSRAENADLTGVAAQQAWGYAPAVAPPHELPAPAVQPKQWGPVVMRRR